MGSPTVKKGRHRRYEEARAMKRGPDLDIEGLFNDLESDRPPALPDDDIETDLDPDDERVEELDDDDWVSEESERG